MSADGSLTAEDYARTRAGFRDVAARLALLREALLDFGFGEPAALHLCSVWFESAVQADEEGD